MNNPLRLRWWLFWAVCSGLLLSASFVCGFTWGFPEEPMHRMAAAGACGVVALMLIGMVAQVAADWRAIRRRERAELRQEIARHYPESTREGLRER